MASGIERVLINLEQQGFVDIVLPFLLIFTIMFAVLQKTHILGEKKKNFNVLVSVIIALLVIIPHATGRYTGRFDPIDILNNAIPQISIFIVAIVFLLIMIGVFGQDKIFLGASAPGWVLFLSLLIVIMVFGGAAGWWDGELERILVDVFGPDAIAVIVMLIVFGIVIMFITSDKDDKMKTGVDLGQLFGGGNGGGGHH